MLAGCMVCSAAVGLATVMVLTFTGPMGPHAQHPSPAVASSGSRASASMPSCSPGTRRPPEGLPTTTTAVKPGDADAVRELFESIAPAYDRLNDLLSLGLHRLWKRQAVAWLRPRPGQRLLDLCCGTGDLALVMAQAVRPGGLVVGLDAAAAPLERARHRGRRQPWLPLEWRLGDALATGLPDGWADGAVMAYGLRNLGDPEPACGSCAGCCAPGDGQRCWISTARSRGCGESGGGPAGEAGATDPAVRPAAGGGADGTPGRPGGPVRLPRGEPDAVSLRGSAGEPGPGRRLPGRPASAAGGRADGAAAAAGLRSAAEAARPVPLASKGSWSATVQDFRIEPVIHLGRNRLDGGNLCWWPEGRPPEREALQALAEDPVTALEVSAEQLLLALQLLERLPEPLWLSVVLPPALLPSRHGLFRALSAGWRISRPCVAGSAGASWWACRATAAAPRGSAVQPCWRTWRSCTRSRPVSGARPHP